MQVLLELREEGAVEVSMQIAMLEQMKERLRREASSWRHADKATVGDFTYGVPIIRTWGEDARLYIGKFCSIGGNVQIFLGGDHRNDWCTTYPFNALLPEVYGSITGNPKSKGDVIIGNDVWIGSDAKIMSGVTIGDGATIAGSAVVTKDVKPYEIVGGVPTHHLGWRIGTTALAVKVWNLKWWDWPIEKIADAVTLLQSDNVDGLVEFSERWDAEHGSA